MMTRGGRAGRKANRRNLVPPLNYPGGDLNDYSVNPLGLTGNWIARVRRGIWGGRVCVRGGGDDDSRAGGRNSPNSMENHQSMVLALGHPSLALYDPRQCDCELTSSAPGERITASLATLIVKTAHAAHIAYCALGVGNGDR